MNQQGKQSERSAELRSAAMCLDHDPGIANGSMPFNLLRNTVPRSAANFLWML